MYVKAVRVVMVLAALAQVRAVCAETKLWTRELADGVTLTQMVESGGKSGPQFINALTIDPKKAQVRTILAQDRVMADDPIKGRETVSSMVRRTGAVAGVNGDYHNWIGDPDNLFILNGELVSEPWSRRPVFGVRADGTFVFDKLGFDARATASGGASYTIGGINRQPDGDELVIFTPRYFSTTLTKPRRVEAVIEVESGLPARAGAPIRGKVTTVSEAGNTAIPTGSVVLSGVEKSGAFVTEQLKPGTEVTITMDLKPRETRDWSDVTYAVGGCPWIVRNGRFWMDAEEEHIVPGFYDVPNPRTAVGRRADGKLVIVTVDGRQAMSVGMKLSELAAVMISLGCVEAINLDGGGSTEMAGSQGVLNCPSDGFERATATCLAVFGRTSPLPVTPEFRISPLPGRMTSGESARLGLVYASSGLPLRREMQEQAVWSTDGRVGVADLSGTFHALKAHSGLIGATIGGRTASAPVEVRPGAFSRIIAFLDSSSGQPANVQRLRVWTRDANANPLRFRKVRISVTGGSAGRTEVETNDDGVASVLITWDAGPKSDQRVEVECEGQKAAVERRE